MKKFLLPAILAVVISTTISAIVLETNNLEDVLKYSDKETLVIFDVDETIAYPSQSVMREYKTLRKNLNIKGLYFIIQFFIDLLPINNSPNIIENLQLQNINVMAMTKRPPLIAKRTAQQLKKIKIDFSINSIFSEKMELPFEHSESFLDGIIFCGDNNKGPLLFHFLDKIGYKVTKLVFIDDHFKNVDSVAKEAQKRSVDFTGLVLS